MRRLPVVVCLLALGLSGCSMWSKQHAPTANDNATRVPVTARPVSTAPLTPAAGTPGTASPGRATASSARSSGAGSASPGGAGSGSATPSVAGEVPPMTSLGLGPAVYGRPATAGPGAAWSDSCKAWELRSSGGTPVGQALTMDTTPAGNVFAVRTDHPGIVGPGGLHVGSSTADVASAMPDGRRADSPDGTWVSRPDPATRSQFVVLLSRAGKVSVMAVVPADKTVEGYPAKPLC